jgi:hypothetical protein
MCARSNTENTISQSLWLRDIIILFIMHIEDFGKRKLFITKSTQFMDEQVSVYGWTSFSLRMNKFQFTNEQVLVYGWTSFSLWINKFQIMDKQVSVYRWTSFSLWMNELWIKKLPPALSSHGVVMLSGTCSKSSRHITCLNTHILGYRCNMLLQTFAGNTKHSQIITCNTEFYKI